MAGPVVLSKRLVQAPISELSEHPRNPRRGNLEAVVESIRANGYLSPIVAQHSTGFVIDGNHRLRAARELGMAKVPVVWVDVDDATALAYLLAANRTSDLAEYDDEALAALLTELADGPGLLGTGWEQDALDALLAELVAGAKAGELEEPPVDFDAAAALAKQFGTAIGQLWSMSGQCEHRLLIADAADPKAPARLLGKESIDLVVTSPPYNVGVKYGEHDDKTVPWSEYRDFLLSVLNVWVPRIAEGRFVAWNIGVSPKVHHARQLVMFEDDLGLTFWRQLMWDKPGVSPSWYTTTQLPRVRAFYPSWRHEVVYLLTKGEVSYGELIGAGGVDDNMAADVMRIGAFVSGVPDGASATGTGISDTKAKKKAHPAAFPVQVPAGPITHLSDPGAIVFDPFMGAGSTILAAEQRGRRGYGVELSPAYAAVALFRASAVGMTVTRLD